MRFLVIIAVLAIHKYWAASVRCHSTAWLERYDQWVEPLRRRLGAIGGKRRELFRTLGWILPFPLAVFLLCALIGIGLGFLGSFLFNVVVLGYCLELDTLTHQYKEGGSIEGYFSDIGEKIFAPIFWYMLFGPAGVALYWMVRLYSARAESHAVPSFKGWMDWVPVRLLGLSFAMMGHFSSVFNEWAKDLFSAPTEEPLLIAKWGEAALEGRHATGKIAEASQLHEAHALMERTLFVWLVALALISISAWIG
ncbi:MAG TPA: regulatory signaling modulator protein AmpE [Coxiellaceae bacterium]|nr:regulatory signaling modulator protein AmpE [Coxiellaceae bacterium]